MESDGLSKEKMECNCECEAEDIVVLDRLDDEVRHEPETQESRASKEIRLAKAWETKDAVDKGEEDDVMLKYACSCYDSALEVYKVLMTQDHSGMSIKITQGILNKLINGKPLSPILNTEEEWYEPDKRWDKGIITGYSSQNKRMSSLFKYFDLDMNVTGYSYLYIVEVINDDKVWQTYPPVDEAGSLDDDDPRVKKYFSARTAKGELHCKDIKFPKVNFPTFKYEWDFRTETLWKVK